MSDYINEINKEIDQIDEQIIAIASTLKKNTRSFYDSYSFFFVKRDLGWLIYEWMSNFEDDINEKMLEEISTDYSKLKEIKKLLIELYELEIQL